MSDSDILFAAIQKQRWYFFENNDKIIFDSTTGLIWVNLKFFPYKKDDNNPYSIKEAAGLLKQMNLQNWGGCGNWKIPTPYEFWIMIEDKSFPYRQGNFWRIKSEYYGWCINVNGNLKTKDLDFMGAYKGITNDRYADVILCSDALKPPNFISEPRVILNIFRKNNLFPKFNDVIANRIYSTAKTSTKTAAREKLNSPPTFEFDVTKYDAASIDKSPIKFYKAIISAVEEMFELLQRYEEETVETISDASKIALKFNAKYIDSPHLSPEENKLLAERQKFFARRLSVDTEDAKAQILSMKAQAEELAARIDEINRSENSLRELAEIEKLPRPSFEFFIENLAQIFNFAQDKITFFVENEKFVTALVKNMEAYREDYISFKTNLRAQFENLCRQNSIDTEIFNNWYGDWQKFRFNIEGRVLPLIQFGLKENLGDVAISVLEKLNTYKNDVDNFYLNERKNIHQKFAFQAGGDLQEKFEVESSLYKLTEKFQRALQEIIFKCEKIEWRVFLLRWAEILTNIPIDEITAFVNDKNLDAISVEVLNQFAELKGRNFAAYLADSQVYSEALQKREQEFNALVFKMRKDLQGR